METAAHMTSHSAAAINHPALAATHYWDHCEMPVAGVERHAALAPLAAAFNLGGAAAVISARRGHTRNGYVARAWALAMTAVHGPVGMHPSQEMHPDVIRAKDQAAASLRTFLGV